MALITVAARSELIALYAAMFKAAPGATNLTDMVAAYEAGGTTSSIAKTLAAKADFATVYPGYTTAAEFAASLVSNLLGSDVTAAITTWSTDYVVGLLNSGKSRADAIVTAVVALRATTNTGFVAAQAALANKVDVASYYSMTQGQSGTSLGALQSVIATVTSVASTVAAAKASVDVGVVAAPSQTFTLTTGPDTLSGSSFSATGATLTSLDSLTGTGTKATLTITDTTGASAAGLPGGVTLANIPTVNLVSSGSVTSGYSSAKTYTFSAANGADTATVYYGVLSTAVNLGTTNTANATNVAAAINAMAGSTIATVASNVVTVTGATSGIAFANFSVAGDAATIAIGTATNSSSSSYNVSGTNVTGLTNFNVISSGTVGDNITAATTTNVTDNAVLSGATVTGGNNVTVTAAGAITISDAVGAEKATTSAGNVSLNGGTTATVTNTGTGTVTIGNTAGPTGAVSVTETNATAGAIAVNGGSNVTVTETATATAGAITVGGASAAVSPTGAVSVTQKAVTGAAISVGGGTNVTINSTGGANIGAGVSNTYVNPTGTVTINDTHTANRKPVALGLAGSSGSANYTVSSTAGLDVGMTVYSNGASGFTASTGYVPSGKTITSITNATTLVLSDVAPTQQTPTLSTNSTTTVTPSSMTGLFVGQVIASSNVPVGAYITAVGSTTITISLAATATAVGTASTIGGTLTGVAVGFASAVNNNDSITVDTFTNTVAGTSGAVSINTARTSGPITVGVDSTTGDVVTGGVTIVNNTPRGAINNYGSSTTNVYANGNQAVSITGAGTTAVKDASAVDTLTTVSLTGVNGTATLTSDALSTINVNNSAKAAGATTGLNSAIATVVSVSNATVDHTLTVNLNNDSNGVTVTDATAQVINVNAAGTGPNTINLANTDTPVSGAKTIALSNTATGKLTLSSAQNTGATTNITTAGTGEIAVGDVSVVAAATTTTITTGVKVLPTSITGTGTGTVTATIDPSVTNFTGGAGTSIVTLNLASTSTGITKDIVGGSGTNDMIILTAKAADYNIATFGGGGSLNGFEKINLGSYTPAVNAATVKTAISGTTVTLSTAPTTGSDTGVYGAAMGIQVGDYVTGYGVSPGTKVSAVSTSAYTVTLDTAAPVGLSTAAASKLVFTRAANGSYNLDGTNTVVNSQAISPVTVVVNNNQPVQMLQSGATSAKFQIANPATVNAYLSGGAAAAYTLVLASGLGAGIVVGSYISGTGIPAGTTVTGVSSDTLTLSAALSAQASGNYTAGGLVPATHTLSIVIDGVTVTTASIAVGASNTAMAAALVQAINKAGTVGSVGGNAALAGVSASYSTGTADLATTYTITVTGAKNVSQPVPSATVSGVTYTNVYQPAAETISLSGAATKTALGNTLPVTLNDAALSTSSVSGLVDIADYQKMTINSVKDLGSPVNSNTLVITDSTPVANANSLTSITVTGNGGTTLAYRTLGALDATTTASATSSASTTLNVTSATGMAVGDVINGPGITAGTTITAISTNALTLSAAASVASTATILTAYKPALASAVTTIDGSSVTGGLNVSNVLGAATGVTVTGGSKSLTAVGSGMHAGESAAGFLAAVDTLKTGAGGGTLTVGYGGAAGQGGGSETINLTASTAVADTVILAIDGTYGPRATISGFTTGVGGASSVINDVLQFSNSTGLWTAYTPASTPTTATSVNTTGTATSAAAVAISPSAGVAVGTGITEIPIAKALIANNAGGSTAALVAGSTDLYTVTTGVITFTGSDSLAVKLNAAKALVNAGTDKAAAFGFGGNTYVVTSGGTADDQHNGVTTLLGVTGITQLGGLTQAAGNLIAKGIQDPTGLYSSGTTGASAAAADTATTAVTIDELGKFAYQAVSGSQTGGTLHTYNNLAPSAQIVSKASGTWALATTQTAAAGQNSMTLNLNSDSSGTQQILSSATISGDSTLAINVTGNANSAVHTITSLVDATNTLQSITITNNGAFTNSNTVGSNEGAFELSAITSTSLTAITVSNTAKVTLGSSATPLTQAGLSVTLPGSQSTASKTDAQAVYLSGAGAKITATGTGGTSSGTLTLSATGDKSTVLAGPTSTDNITVGTNGTVTFQQGSGGNLITGYGGTSGTSAKNDSTVIVGLGSVVNLSTDAYGVASDAGVKITVTGNIAGTTSSGAYSFVTVSNWVDGKTKIDFGADLDNTINVVNMGSATSLANALDIASANMSGITASTPYVAAFEYGGDTYLLEHTGTGAAATAMVAGDIVVKLVGLSSLASLGTTGANFFVQL